MAVNLEMGRSAAPETSRWRGCVTSLDVPQEEQPGDRQSDIVLIVEDEGYVAELTQTWVLEALPQTDVVIAGTAASALSTVKAVRNRLRLILLDLRIPGASGLSLALQLKELGLAHITCAVTGSDNECFPVQLKGLGFLGYVPKAGPASDLRRALSMVFANERTFVWETSGATPQLTRRQVEILQEASTGLLSKEIARVLGVTAGTVDNHVAAAMAALGAKTRADAVTRALALGLIQARV